MKAITYTKYGPPEVLELTEVAKPVPAENEVLVKVHAAALNAYDWHLMRGKPALARPMMGGMFRPKNGKCGADMAGVVEAVGSDVTRFQPGDAVFGDLAAIDGGSLAEYICAPENLLANKPVNLSFEETASLPMAGITALQALRDSGQIKAGQKVLIHGASGGVGSFAVQIACAFGAEVTAVCSTSKVALTRSLGASRVIDYTQEDFSQTGEKYDLILGVGGSVPLAKYRRALKPTGIYVMAGGSNRQIFGALLLGGLYSRKGGQQMGSMTAKASQDDLFILKQLVESGKLKPTVDRVFPLAQAREAMHYLESGHPAGKVVVSVLPSA